MTTARADPQPPSLRPPRLRPRTVMIGAAAVLVLAWVAVILVDGHDLGGTQSSRSVHLFELLFVERQGERAVEWLQWLGLAAVSIGAAYTAGRLSGSALGRERAFWLLIAVGVALMLVEDAGEIRNAISDRASSVLGESRLGVSTSALVEVPYFAALAALPVYALVRHGPVIWTYRPVRPYLVTGVVLYAIAASSSSIRQLGRGDDLEGSLYSRLGEQLNTLLGLEHLPGSDLAEGDFHYHLIDGIVEETLELLAIGGIFAALLAFVATASARAEEREGPGEGDEARRR